MLDRLAAIEKTLAQMKNVNDELAVSFDSVIGAVSLACFTHCAAYHSFKRS